MTITERLIEEQEPHPVVVERPQGASEILLLCDHAGRRVPALLGDLGLEAREFDRHIAWDIGARAVSQQISAAIDATLIRQVYSRLVIDCNRPPEVPSSIPEVSEATRIPGNLGLQPAEREARRGEIFEPYHAAIAAEIERREAMHRPVVLVAMHSFTPVYLGETRPWHIGTLYGRDSRLARALLEQLAAEDGLVVGDNEPYSVSALTDYTIPVHGEARGLLHVGIEIRQDLIAGTAGQGAWAERLARVLPRAVAGLVRPGQARPSPRETS